MSQATQTVMNVSELTRFSQKVLQKSGLDSEGAKLVTENLIQANLRGVDSHGVTRIPVYVERLLKGLVNRQPSPKPVHSSGASMVLDGDNGMGAVVGSQAMAEAIALATQFGIGAVAVRNSNHFGAAAYYVMQALEHNCIALACSNAPPTMAPWGGRVPFFGTNPMAFAIPAGDEPPVVMDMATSIVARGKIMLAAQRGDAIPETWAIDTQGSPTTDATAALAGAVLPFGGAKGYGISLLIDVLAGVLSGATFAPRVNGLYDNDVTPQDLGHFFVVLHLSYFGDIKDFQSRMDHLIRDIKASPTAQGVDQILLPGELEFWTECHRKRHGIPLSADVIKQLDEVGRRFGVALVPCEVHPTKGDEGGN